MAKILIVEDDLDMLRCLSECLELANYVVQRCTNGKDAAFSLKHYDYDLVILDLELPDHDGISVLKNYRVGGGKAPVLILTGKTDIKNKQTGLDSGADDYLTKPFDIRELGARVRALLRRPVAVLTENILKIGDIILDPQAKMVMKGGQEIKLVRRELQLLEFMMRHQSEALSTSALLTHIWEDDSDATEEAVRSTMKRLRRKLDPQGEYINNIHGVGYVFKYD